MHTEAVAFLDIYGRHLFTPKKGTEGVGINMDYLEDDYLDCLVENTNMDY